jgi:hypothetical protein
MKARAIYTNEVTDDGRTIHSIHHDGGGFVVSSEKVGVAVQNFLHHATSTDILTVHQYLLYAFKQAWNEEAEQDSEEPDPCTT